MVWGYWRDLKQKQADRYHRWTASQDEKYRDNARLWNDLVDPWNADTEWGMVDERPDAARAVVNQVLPDALQLPSEAESNRRGDEFLDWAYNETPAPPSRKVAPPREYTPPPMGYKRRKQDYYVPPQVARKRYRTPDDNPYGLPGKKAKYMNQSMATSIMSHPMIRLAMKRHRKRRRRTRRPRRY